MINEGEGDISVMLSSALISKITQEYFNKVMFKQRVEIVDLRPANDGYMFVVAFVNGKVVEPVTIPTLQSTPEEFERSINKLVKVTQERESNGTFAKKEKV